MREILFRGKRKTDNKWLYGFPYITRKNAVKINWYCSDFGSMRTDEVDPETVGQYTGLTDKNGKKVFEGDIFKFSDEIWENSYTSCGTEWDSWKVENYAVVGFDDERSGFDFVKYKFCENSVEADFHENHDIEFAEFISSLEVIGNIHDNPELMEAKDD